MAEELQQQDSQEHPETPTNNKRIAKNALMLYIRMFLTMIVGLYTSRVVLATLGVEDYGIYGVVGSITAMMAFLNSAMSAATSRFLSFELGCGNSAQLTKTFSNAIIAHICIALIVFVLAETAGLWFLCNKLVIPAVRMNAAHWVYQCSILSAMLGITQAPYNASIIAHEKMDVYAYVEILNVSLKLLIVYLLVIGHFDKLKLYAILVLAVSVLIMLIYRIYCIRNFSECNFKWMWDKNLLKDLLSFSGWDLYGHMAFTFRQQGLNFLINMFCGVAINAACGLASTIQGIVLGFSSNIVTAFRPQIIKQYAACDYDRMNVLISLGTRFSAVLIIMVSLPIIFKAEPIINLWLGQVPQGAVFMTITLLFLNIVNTISYVIVVGIQASGKIARNSIVCGTLYLFCLPVMYFLLHLGFGYESTYWVLLISGLFVLTIYVYNLKHSVIQFKLSIFLLKSLLPIILLLALSSLLLYILSQFFNKSLLHLLLFFIVSILIIGGISFVLVFNRKERDFAITKARSFLGREK